MILALLVLVSACKPQPQPDPSPTTSTPALIDVGTADVGPATDSATAPPDLGKPQPDPCANTPDGMACIPAGPFIRGIDDDPHVKCVQAGNARKSSSMPAATIELDAYFIDLTEVTVGAYMECEKAGVCEKTRPAYRDFSAPDQPLTGMSWFQAQTYCQWKGGHLPTEAQWEKAARGPDGESHPWGNAPATCELAVIKNEAGRSCGREKIGHRPEAGRVSEVAQKPAGRYGVFDLSGNAEEWVQDWWSTSWEACGEACLGKNPLGPCDGAAECDGHRYKTVRGGSWYWPSEHATGYHRRRHFPSNKPYHHFGFRCAAEVPHPTHRIVDPAGPVRPL